jgi:alpha-glucosidase
MRPLTGARLTGRDHHGIDVALARGYGLRVLLLGERLVRVLVRRPHGLRMDRTWSLSPELAGGNDPIDGRDRLDLTGFSGCAFTVEETEDAIVLSSRLVEVAIARAPLSLTWRFRADETRPFSTVLADRPTQAYLFDRATPRLQHFLVRDPNERYYGFGEKTGDADKHGERLLMETRDPLGYDAGRTDPLYKHIPFYVTVRPDRGGDAVGLFYDNLARGAFDLGREIDAYHGAFRSFEASDGDLDLYILFGPTLAEVVAGFTTLTGRVAFPPRWTLSYSGSTMQYTDAPNASDRLLEYIDRLTEHRIPCRSFQMSSGYTLVGDKRCVFTWNRERFPDPKAVTARFADAGIELVANIKPALLLEHPRYGEVEAFGGFVRDSDDPTKPHVAQFWGGPGSYLDFTNPRASAWWSGEVRRQLIDMGIASTWNDNNEFEIWDDEARCDLAGRSAPIACLRPVLTNLMLRASLAAQIAAAPARRPYLISRSGGPGLQRYVQTWSGDNRTAWPTLRYNLRMGHGMSLSGLFNHGHDVGGFAGPPPEPELFLRWVEQGVFWPRFTIHSWNDDGSATEPWMYPDILPRVRACLEFRERLVPLLYTLLWRAHRHHEPILRPVFLDFPDQPDAYREDDTFLLGRRLLVAPVCDPGATTRTLRLPACPEGWYDLWGGTHHAGGQTLTVDAPLGRAPAFLRGASLLPLGPCPSWRSGPLTLRVAVADGETAELELYDDDGASVLPAPYTAPTLLGVTARRRGDETTVDVERHGVLPVHWTELRFEDPAGRPMRVKIDGTSVDRLSMDRVPKMR